MTTALTVVVVVVLVALAGLALATAAGAPLERASTLASAVAEALLVVSAVVDVARILAGHRPDELLVHLGYVLVSVFLVPVLVRPVEADASDDDVRGRQLVLALAAVAVLVVVLRQRATA